MGYMNIFDKKLMKARLLLLLLVIISLFSKGNAQTTVFPSCPTQAGDCSTKLVAAETFDHTTLKGAKYDNGAIIRAIKRGDADVAECLVHEEVDLHHREPDTGKTPLMYATEYGEYTMNLSFRFTPALILLISSPFLCHLPRRQV